MMNAKQRTTAAKRPTDRKEDKKEMECDDMAKKCKKGKKS